MEPCYNRTADEVCKQFEVGNDGLSSARAAQALEKFGPNALAEGKRKGVLAVFAEQFKDLLVVILVAAAVISMLSGNHESTIVIFAVLVLNAILGTVQHFKAEKSLASLKALSAPSAKVLRDGVKIELPSREIVPGDLVMLEAGDLVVADGRMVENFSLQINESSLTGESEGVNKQVAVIEGVNVPLGDQKNMVFSGSLVTYGRAHVLVTATGMQTELGKIATLMNQTKEKKTPLQISLDSFSQKLAVIILIICAAVFGLSLYRSMPVLDSLMFAVALAVAAIPEALSSIVTIVLAIGTQKMAKQNAIIKDLKAVESLGSVSVICSDKTGTLTQNRMTTQEVFVCGELLRGEVLDTKNTAHRLLMLAAVLASDATSRDGNELGDPTEVALVKLGQTLGLEEGACRGQYPRLSELAFDSDRKLMSTLHEIDGGYKMLTKGAIDVLTERCNTIMDQDGPRPMTQADHDMLATINAQLSDNGLRVLAFACRDMEANRPLTLEDEADYTLLGLISMIDPPREESKLAVADAKRAGIRTVMITGDHKATASAIARQLGILNDAEGDTAIDCTTDGETAIDGVTLDSMTEAQLDEILPRITVYARVSPNHKIRIVDAWQRRGNIVSMTGDGVNDAPALKQANIGVAMGITGTEVSKDAASMILTDDNFATIVKAVTNGRNVYTNIKNSIQFLLSGNMSGILSVLYTSLFALPVPFAPVHLLFINLLTDSLPAIAIGMEPARDDLLEQKPRNPKEPILTRDFLKRIFVQGAIIGVFTMIAYHIGLGTSAALASTMAFSTLTLARLFHGFNCRGKKPIWKLGFTTNTASIGAFVLGLVFLNSVLFIPVLERLFSVAPMTGAQIGTVYLLAFLPTLMMQIYKAIRMAICANIQNEALKSFL